MPTTQIELDNRHESLDGIIDVGNREEEFGMAHEALKIVVSSSHLDVYYRVVVFYFVMRSNMLLGSRMKVGRVTLLRSAPGLS